MEKKIVPGLIGADEFDALPHFNGSDSVPRRRRVASEEKGRVQFHSVTMSP